LNLPKVLSTSLSKGEVENLTLALELKTNVVLLDDLKVHKTTRKLGLESYGDINCIISTKSTLFNRKP
ncbi:MAG: hypothetical protein ACP5KW_10720, partial [Thermoproteota archaeon]